MNSKDFNRLHQFVISRISVSCPKDIMARYGLHASALKKLSGRTVSEKVLNSDLESLRGDVQIYWGFIDNLISEFVDAEDSLGDIFDE